jgi:NAD-reducing hydrogenase small subunit
MERLKLATVWLGGCSGCHMSFLDLDEWLLELNRLADIVYCPLLDVKEFPHGVDVTLVEGAVANADHLEMIHKVRSRSRLVLSFGDCAVTGNVTALRNQLGGAEPVLRRSYIELATLRPQLPGEAGVLPPLIDRVRPLHEVVTVDGYLPGCPPPAPRIRELLEVVVRGEKPTLAGEFIRFG